MQLKHNNSLIAWQRNLLSKQFNYLMPIIVNIAKFLKKHDYVVERYGNLAPAIFKDAVYGHRMNFIIKNPCRVYIR
jgi:hypothetical protein